MMTIPILKLGEMNIHSKANSE